MSTNVGEGQSEHPYLKGLKAELIRLHGVYIFHDSRGQAIYVGQAKKSLWNEMNLAFNRDRGELQQIRRVNHPNNQVQFRTSDEKRRQIVQREVQLFDLAYYCSAYVVDDSMIGSVEALLVRSFANDLLNKKMEKFVEKKAKTTKKRS